MNFYDAKIIKRDIPISKYFRDQGVPIHGNRAVAIWRDGHHDSVSFDDDKGVWFDHVVGAGGTVVDAYIAIEGGYPLEAVRNLGDRYGVEPLKTKQLRRMTKAEKLVAEGWTFTVSYTYTDEEGNALYYVDRYERRLEKPDESGKDHEKTFVQRSPTAENLDGVRRVLYNLPAVIKADTVYIAEGEKNCETLRGLNLVGTTNSGGGKTWNNDFNSLFTGKNVVILPDNDPVGEEHARLVMSALKPYARDIRICRVSKIPKGDITNFIEEEGGTLAKLTEMVRASRQPDPVDPAIAEAKIANETPLVNYVTAEGKKKKEMLPRMVDDICDDIRKRFLDFPRRLGGNLFDYTRPCKRNPERKIEYLLNKSALRSWIDGTSRHQSHFMGGGAFPSWDEVFERLHQTAPQYDGIAAAPWFPNRADVFPIFSQLPPPDPTNALFEEFMRFFNPATPADRTLLKAFFMAPMFYNGTDDKPAWVIDTVDAQQSGKTSVVKACAWLYDEEYLDMDLKTVNGDITQLKKRLLSSEGRQKRIALFDNLDQTLKSGNLANLITAQAITGMAPYGHGEETRKNDITWCATVNGAEVDTDMATRSYTARIHAPTSYKPHWKRDLKRFLDAHRPQMHADMIYRMQHAPERLRNGSRFAAFDAVVLSAACDTDAEFDAVCELIRRNAEKSNEDNDRAAELVELVTTAVARSDEATSGIRTDNALVIRSMDLDDILRRSSGSLSKWKSQKVRRLVKTGKVPQFDKHFEMPETAVARSSGVRVRSFLFFPNEMIPRWGKVPVQYVVFTQGLPKAVATDTLKIVRSASDNPATTRKDAERGPVSGENPAQESTAHVTKAENPATFGPKTPEKPEIPPEPAPEPPPKTDAENAESEADDLPW